MMLFYGFPLCERCLNYYMAENMPSDRLKKVLRIKESPDPAVNGLEDWEKEMFSGSSVTNGS
jgi:hypothetical protein